ncbi:hypothetical protein KDH_12370 [Dictyobacter sp. S3.2.2.5]|uniref:ATP-grasp domain-containing protein n=1 Tax=Dictyobacter halimunensis TaxID=3026934 RepID=A0ABQ6FPE0_9CHLR|nr:hypothetical protein KDH_12370 [Dictyobacter sp. S3.2.2.5]
MRNVLILTKPYDPHTPPVVEEIQARGARVFRFHTADFPEQSSLAMQYMPHSPACTGTLSMGQCTIELEGLTSIWRRRPQKYRAPHSSSPGEATFIEEEAEKALTGVLESLALQNTCWVSRTHSVRRADLKALQLAMARDAGLRIPETLITNDPDAARAFYERCQGNVILKAVSKGSLEDAQGQIERFIYTSQVQREHLAQFQRVRATGHMFQEHIPKRIEVRVVVIGRQVFAAEIHSQHSTRARVDFRRGYDDLRYDVHRLPDDIRTNVLEMVRRFELQYSSIDFIVTPAGEYVFLDLNPNGQYYWLQLRLAGRFRLKEAMADLLVFPEDYRL